MANWFRFYDEAVNDPKIIEIPDDLFRAWVNVLCISAKNDGVLPEMRHVALVMRVKPTKAAALVTRLVAAGLIDNHDGVFAPHNWQSRQFKSDDSGPRVKKHREKLRNAKSNTECNVTIGDKCNALEGEEKKIEGEQSRADDGAPVDEDLKRKASALAAGISAHFLSRQQTIPNLDRCLLWLSQGYAAGTVLAAVETVLKRGKVITTLDYFDGAIKDRHAITVVAETATVAPIDWDKTVKRWKSNNSLWPRGVGGEPGMWGCKCPANVLADNQIDPATGRVMNGDWHFIEEGTQEMAAFCHDAQARNTKAPAIFEIEIEGLVQRGSYQPRRWPRGYDEATGEKLQPQSEEDAA